ncbi:hypothetical protein ACJVC5_12420 [Peredibacter sp. HCB2-198]|uniref:hypothetical protein n=1 Tax=Peredibacter sp. HCB2-198 TaxID=3383025 RepID=UPI0038B662D7
MDSGQVSLFIKMIREEYKLSETELTIITRRMLADDREFERIWKLYKSKSIRVYGGIDEFKSVLQDLLN